MEDGELSEASREEAAASRRGGGRQKQGRSRSRDKKYEREAPRRRSRSRERRRPRSRERRWSRDRDRPRSHERKGGRALPSDHDGDRRSRRDYDRRDNGRRDNGRRDNGRRDGPWRFKNGSRQDRDSRRERSYRHERSSDERSRERAGDKRYRNESDDRRHVKEARREEQIDRTADSERRAAEQDAATNEASMLDLSVSNGNGENSVFFGKRREAEKPVADETTNSVADLDSGDDADLFSRETPEERLIRERRERREKLLRERGAGQQAEQHNVRSQPLGQHPSSSVESKAENSKGEENDSPNVRASVQVPAKDDESAHSSLEDGEQKPSAEDGDQVLSSHNEENSHDEARVMRDRLLRFREMAQNEETAEAVPGPGKKSERRRDIAPIFDIFSESPTDENVDELLPKETMGKTISDNVDATDVEGYYIFRPGELLDDGRYLVMSTAGKGVFSTVIRAKIVESQQDIAIKAIRNNEVMHRAGQKEVNFLQKLKDADPNGKRHCVQFMTSFQHKGHLCIVFESLHINLRELLRRYGSGRGISMQGVRIYARQILSALHLLQKCKIVHADIKPDNIMVNEAKTAVKLCDFGSASSTEEGGDITPYLVSRFYRAPEIVLGLPFGTPIDMWSVGCCLYELYTGKIAFPGRDNNEMLKLFQDVRGAVPSRLVRRAQFRSEYYDEQGRFMQKDIDPVTKAEVLHVVTVPQKPKRDLRELILAAAESTERKLAVLLADLLDKMFMIDPTKRITVANALKHDFFSAAV
mmetsp:Transcript_3864/g.11537  ORF Transcript_3864/g.11537 Transcript_3864/m.11537 type:complete len:760 (+) Transcript_3864:83-2362(+)